MNQENQKPGISNNAVQTAAVILFVESVIVGLILIF